MKSRKRGKRGRASLQDDEAIRSFGRALSMAWISDELIRDTQRVWSPRYGRDLSEDEAVEILMNVKRLAELLLEITQERQTDQRNVEAGTVGESSTEAG